jgi:TRAP-type C4-dicarboxylate transport system permease large subunit
MSAPAIADAAGLGTIEIKAMRDHGYSKEFSVGVTAASATLGPDHSAVASLRDLWDGGQRVDRPAVPRGNPAGLVMTVLMMLTVGYYAHKNNWGADIKFLWSRVGKAAVELGIVIAFPLVIWGAILLNANPVMATFTVHGPAVRLPTGNGSSRRCCRS